MKRESLQFESVSGRFFIESELSTNSKSSEESAQAMSNSKPDLKSLYKNRGAMVPPLNTARAQAPIFTLLLKSPVKEEGYDSVFGKRKVQTSDCVLQPSINIRECGNTLKHNATSTSSSHNTKEASVKKCSFLTLSVCCSKNPQIRS